VRFRRQRVDKAEIQENWQPRLYGRLLLLALLVAYVIAFVIENRKQVKLRFVFATASVSLIWLILLSLAIGAITGVLLAQLDRRSRRRRSSNQPG
jgi:uncharacterized integral membrane protein